MTNETAKANFLIEIVDKHLSVDEVKKRIQELEIEYGNDFFLDYDIEETGIILKPQEEWNEEYYEEVKNKGILGTTSKQYFLYFAELNEYIYNQKLHKIQEQKKKKTKIIIMAAIAAVIILVLLICFNLSKTNAAEFYCSQPTFIAVSDKYLLILQE